ncbi:MAG: methyl-accepting chemotaxis protein [Bacteroidales bacterium]|nr:methyl-accepting chemotaxis protein [Bacteroidales bacterium]MCM1416226.1 methyl-accepting chemotaxis protein [bacterium]MCM1423347.1 methyl-accepting chemotaxis protein [bacterium]
MEEKKKKLGIMAQLVMLCVIPMVVMVAAVTVYAINTMRSMVHDSTMESLQNVCQSVFAAYDALDSGYYHMDGDVLYKGEYCVSENVEVIDSFVEGSNADVTIFYGDTRRATSLRDKTTGERILGTKASDAVIQTVLNEGKVYETDDVTINGERYYAYYMPAKDDTGKVVGMVFAGQPATEAISRINQSSMMILGMAVFILAIALVICIKIASAIARVIAQTEGLLSSLAEGNLHLEVNGRILKRTDEIGVMGHAVQRLLNELQKIIGSIKDNTDALMQQGENLEGMASQTSTTADEISRAVEDISKGAVSMAEDIESATGQVANMGHIIEKIVDRVKELNGLSEQMHVADVESARIINELSASNDKTTEAIKKIEVSVHTTNESVTRIQDAVNLIASIASETSLLALNASIEAARAGEAGRGFAVVATQISKLSEDSAQSTKTIEDIIHQLTADSEASVQIMNEVNEIIVEQQKKLEQTKEKFGDVSRGIEDSRKESDLINEQAGECDSERGKVVDVIQNLSAVSQENAASTEETTASMEELNATINLLAEEAGELKQLAQHLEEEVSFFKL